MKAKLISALLTLLVMLPIQIYLQYSVFKLVGATELMWFLFWANLPLVILVSIINKIIEKD